MKSFRCNTYTSVDSKDVYGCTKIVQFGGPGLQLRRGCCRVPPPRYFGKRGCKPLKTNDGRRKKRAKRLQVIESRAVRAHTDGKIGNLSDKFRCEFSGSEARKGVRWLAGYFMGYYTIWLAPVKRFFVPFWEFGGENEVAFRPSHEQFKTRSLRTQGCGTREKEPTPSSNQPE